MTLSTTSLRLSRHPSFALDAPPLDFAEGETFGVLGPNGAGKSTLLHVLAGHLAPDSGSVSWRGAPLHRLGSRRWARNVAFVAQETGSAPQISVRQFVRMGRIPFRGLIRRYTREDEQIVSDALRRCGLAESSEAGYAELSGGQRQRARIARALAQEPRILLLDEPTNHLDLAAVRDLVELLRGLARTGVGIVVSLHDLDLAAILTDRVAILERGRVTRSGATRTVLTPSTIRAHWAVDVIRVPDGDAQRFLLDHPGRRAERTASLEPDLAEETEIPYSAFGSTEVLG